MDQEWPLPVVNVPKIEEEEKKGQDQSDYLYTEVTVEIPKHCRRVDNPDL